MRGFSDALRVLKDDLHLLAERPQLAAAEADQLAPSNVTLPPVASARRRITRPAVVFPEPTRRRSQRFTGPNFEIDASTAFTSATWRCRIPP